jgi:hypothetical protein
MAGKRHGADRFPVGIDDEAIARSFGINSAYLRALELDTKFRRGISGWVLDPSEWIFLQRLYSAKPAGRMILANKHVQQAASNATIDALLTDFLRAPNRARYLLTFCWNAGVSWERRPKIDLVSLKNMINHRLRRLRLHGIGVVEIDILSNLTGEAGRRVMAHVHCYCWTDSRSFKPRVVARKLSKKISLSNDLGARSVVIEPVKLTDISAARLAAYLVKPPSRGKNRVPRRKLPGKYVMRDVALEPSTATRMIEILSRIEFRDILFGVGEGRDLAKEIRKNFGLETSRWRGRKWKVPDPDIVAHYWIRIRLHNGSRRFRRPVIITRAAQRQLPKQL